MTAERVVQRLSQWVKCGLVMALAVASAGCAGGGSPTASPESSESPETPQSISIDGRLATFYVLQSDCEAPDLHVADPDPQGADEIFAELELAKAVKIVSTVQDQTVSIRDGAGAEVAEATTTSDATLLETERKKNGFGICWAVTDWSAEVPSSPTYSFTVEGVAGSWPPVSIDDLEQSGFKCDLLLDSAKEQLGGDVACGDLARVGIPD